MANKSFVYFVSLSSNAPYVLKDALRKVEQNNNVSVFFDLDGAHVLDKRYMKSIERIHNAEDLSAMIQSAVEAGIKLYGCQMNVLIADGHELVEGAETAGVVTFLDMAYEADAVLSY